MADTVGFIGLGVMGRPMARHVLAKGHAVVAFNRSRVALEDFVARRKAEGGVKTDF